MMMNNSNYPNQPQMNWIKRKKIRPFYGIPPPITTSMHNFHWKRTNISKWTTASALSRPKNNSCTTKLIFLIFLCVLSPLSTIFIFNLILILYFYVYLLLSLKYNHFVTKINSLNRSLLLFNDYLKFFSVTSDNNNNNKFQSSIQLPL